MVCGVIFTTLAAHFRSLTVSLATDHTELKGVQDFRLDG